MRCARGVVESVPDISGLWEWVLLAMYVAHKRFLSS